MNVVAPIEDVGKPGYPALRVRGHRIGIDLVLERYFAGESARQIADHFETLSLDEVQNVIAFYHNNQPALDAYLTQIIAEDEAAMRAGDALPPSPGKARVLAARARRAHS